MPEEIQEASTVVKPERKPRKKAVKEAMIGPENKPEAAPAVVVFTHAVTKTGACVRANLMYEGKRMRATAALTEAGLTKLRAWVRGKIGDAKLTETVKLDEAVKAPVVAAPEPLTEAALFLDANDPLAKKLAHASFPDYNGRKFKVRIVPEGTDIDITSYWDGGSRDYFAVVNLVTMRSVPVPQNGDPNTKRLHPIKIHENMCVVEHAIFMGKDAGLTFIISEKNAAQLLPPSSEDLSSDEKKVLFLVRSTISRVRREYAAEAGIDAKKYDELTVGLKKKGYLSPSGGITPKGKNVVSGINSIRQIGESVEPIMEQMLKEDTVKFLETHKNFAVYLSFLLIRGEKFLRGALNGKGTAEFSVGRNDLYINGDEWTMQDSHGKVMSSGNTPDSLANYLYDNRL